MEKPYELFFESEAGGMNVGALEDILQCETHADAACSFKSDPAILPINTLEDVEENPGKGLLLQQYESNLYLHDITGPKKECTPLQLCSKETARLDFAKFDESGIPESDKSSSSSDAMIQGRGPPGIDEICTRKQVQKPPTTAGISLDDLKAVFHLERPQAEKMLRLKRTTFSNLSRHYGIAKWPFRTIRDAMNRMKANESLLSSKGVSKERRRKIIEQQRLLKGVIALIYSDPKESRDSNTLAVLLRIVASRETGSRYSEL